MYLTTLTLCLLLLPLGAPQLTGILDSCEMVFKLCDENLHTLFGNDYINGSTCMPECMKKELDHFKKDIQTELELLRQAQDKLKDKLKQGQDELKQGQDELKQALLQHSQQEEMHFQQISNNLTKNCSPKGTINNPVASCKFLPQNSPSGNYWIQNTTTGNAIQVYCDMSSTRCGTRGWMRVANLNMTDTTQNCPVEFCYVSGSGYRGCGTCRSNCVSTTFPVHGVRYSKVCGRINAYQYYSTNAFAPYYRNRALIIDSRYVDGVSLTHGQYPRKHIWTFVAALDETRSDHGVCPCTKTTTPYTGVVPPFIGQNYFCETGSRDLFANRVYTEDPLWDGHGCGPNSTCCSFNNPPWFYKTLPQPTTDDIELRSCVDQPSSNEDVILKSVEIYIQ